MRSCGGARYSCGQRTLLCLAARQDHVPCFLQGACLLLRRRLSAPMFRRLTDLRQGGSALLGAGGSPRWGEVRQPGLQASRPTCTQRRLP